MTTPPTDRVRLRRSHARGAYDKETLYKILDATPQCFVGYIIDGAPYVTPTLHWREGNRVYWHGSSASRALRASTEAQVCLTVSIMDGFVMARSGFHHTVNSRSVMLFGTAKKVTDIDEMQDKLCTFIDGLFPGRSAVLRPNNAQELKATTLLLLEIDEASAKIRTGQPIDDEPDYDLPIWAGVIPISTTVGAPIADPKNMPGVDAPVHITRFRWPE